jgi:predicted ester cyclase
VAHPCLPTQPLVPSSASDSATRGALFSEVQYEVHSVVAEGHEVALRATMSAAQVGTFMGIEPTSKRVSAREMAFFRLEGGKIADMWIMGDVGAIAAQLES